MPAFDPATTMYTATVPYTVTETTITATPTNATAGVSIALVSTLYVSGDILPLAYGSNAINVSVIENNVPYPYTITVTRPQPIGARMSIVPSPVAPGGKVTVTLEFDPKTYGAFALVIETLPAGFSWVFIADADLPDNVSMQLDPPGSQTLHITILGNLTP